MKKLLLLMVLFTIFSLANSQTNMDYIVAEECLCANTSENFKKMTDISVRKDKDGLMKMVNNSEVFILDKGVLVELLEGGIAKSKVKVKSGKQSGKTVYVSSSFIKKK